MKIDKSKLQQAYNIAKEKAKRLGEEAKPIVNKAVNKAEEQFDKFVTEAAPVVEDIKEKASDGIKKAAKKGDSALFNLKQKAAKIFSPSQLEKMERKIISKRTVYLFHQARIELLQRNAAENKEIIAKAVASQKLREKELGKLIKDYNAYAAKQNTYQNATDILNDAKKLK